MRSVVRLPVAMLLPLALLPLAGCATPRAGGLEVAEADRWEATNRKIYKFNKGVDRYALKPVATVYRTVIPKPGRQAVTNAYNNYGEPLTFVNDLLQGKIKKAFRSLDRFVLNTTLGIGGIMDVATNLGRPEEPEDFGQTFAQWGIKSGPYLMLPFIGPSTLRDAFGTGFDFALQPADYGRNAIFHPTLGWKAGQIAVRFVNLRARLTDQGADAMLAGSLDEYTLVKSAYLQNRLNLIWDGNPPYVPEDDGSGGVPGTPATTSPATPPAATPPNAVPPAVPPTR